MRHPRVRITVRIMTASVALAAVALATLLYSSDFWASLWFTVAVGMLLIAVAGVMHRREDSRAFWLGFSLFGWVYLLYGFCPLLPQPIKPPSLILTVITDYLYFILDPFYRSELFKQGGLFPLNGMHYPKSPPGYHGRIDPEAYRQITHSMAALAFALIGGIAFHIIASPPDRLSPNK